jgi:hypothetical protein
MPAKKKAATAKPKARAAKARKPDIDARRKSD